MGVLHMTVRDYFKRRFPAYTMEAGDEQALSIIDLNTMMGEECGTLIDHGAAIVESIRSAHGDQPIANSMVRQVGDVIVNVCSVWIVG